MWTTGRASFEVGGANCVWTVGMTLRDGSHDRSVPSKHSERRVSLGRRCGIAVPMKMVLSTELANLLRSISPGVVAICET